MSWDGNSLGNYRGLPWVYHGKSHGTARRRSHGGDLAGSHRMPGGNAREPMRPCGIPQEHARIPPSIPPNPIGARTESHKKTKFGAPRKPGQKPNNVNLMGSRGVPPRDMLWNAMTHPWNPAGSRRKSHEIPPNNVNMYRGQTKPPLRLPLEILLKPP